MECWFCHEKTKVEYAKQNSFTCPSCEQYNGFTEDGDYNKRIPGQVYTEQKRYCVPVQEPRKPNGFLDRFGGVNMSPSEFKSAVLKQIFEFQKLRTVCARIVIEVKRLS